MEHEHSQYDDTVKNEVEAGDNLVANLEKSSVAGQCPVAAGNAVAGHCPVASARHSVAATVDARPMFWGTDTTVWESNPAFQKIASEEFDEVAHVTSVLEDICGRHDMKMDDCVMHTEAGDYVPQSRAAM